MGCSEVSKQPIRSFPSASRPEKFLLPSARDGGEQVQSPAGLPTTPNDGLGQGLGSASREAAAAVPF